MTCTATMFLTTSELEVYEGATRVFARTWTQEFSRGHCQGISERIGTGRGRALPTGSGSISASKVTMQRSSLTDRGVVV
jgi:hypothetical protein